MVHLQQVSHPPSLPHHPTDHHPAHRKRRPNSPIAQHVSNKRTHIGLATIPASSKAEIFNAIPAAIKVDLFNSVVSTAFPNFDN